MKRLSLLALCLAFLSTGVRAQEVAIDTLNKYGLYDTDRLPPSFHAGRRKLVLDSMAPNSVAVFLSAPKRTRANDVSYLYHQDPNFYYLTGQLEDQSALLLLKEPRMIDGRSTREVLFLRRRDPMQETWVGRMLGLQGGKSVLGFTSVMPIDSLEEVLTSLLGDKQTLYYTPNYDRVLTDPVAVHKYQLQQMTDSLFTVQYPNLQRASLGKTLAALRMVKTPEELRLMQRAIFISNQAHNEIMRQVMPGWHEYEMQALGEYVFGKMGAEYTGYPCIVGSGENSVVLHYETNRRGTLDGDVVEMDIGAEYHGYSADVTRSFPVNGKFTQEQRALYDLVLEAQDSGIAQCQIGNEFKATHRATSSVIGRGLVSLGIIRSPDDYRKYFMHGTSHYLGLDVHDAGTGGPLVANTVITVEPGIYIKAGSDCDPKWWNIGLRIEDDILITEKGPVNMSNDSPRTADDVEALMRSRRAQRLERHLRDE